MKILFAGVPGGGTSGWCKREEELTPMWTHRLWTYYWLIEDKGKMEKPHTVNLFLDSGAFSAWTRGANIRINQYIRFIKKHKDFIDLYANLDVIASSKIIDQGRARRKAAEATLKNQKKMEEAGLNPIPVFHFGEPWEFLENYVANYEYIALGGLVGIPTGMAIEFLDQAFANYICKSDGMPKVKVHGFGLTSLRIMLRYPFYSVDSTSWVVTGRMGGIYVPIYRNGKYIYDENSLKITVSNKSPSLQEKGKHIETLSPMLKKQVLKYIHKKGYDLGKSEFKKVEPGYELKENEKWAEKKNGASDTRLVEVIVEEGISNKYQLRDEMNIIYFNDLQKTMRPWPWPFLLSKTAKLF